MTKIKKIRILKDKLNDGNYTFVDDKNTLFFQSIERILKNEIPEDQIVKIKLEEKYKKKKVLNKKENVQSNLRGLKYMNPSQRNHSSVYE